MIELRSDILRRLERFLHLLGELVDAHSSNLYSVRGASMRS
jgi:hypothetical protein